MRTLTEPASSPFSAAEEVIVKGMPKPLLLENCSRSEKLHKGWVGGSYVGFLKTRTSYEQKPMTYGKSNDVRSFVNFKKFIEKLPGKCCEVAQWVEGVGSEDGDIQDVLNLRDPLEISKIGSFMQFPYSKLFLFACDFVGSLNLRHTQLAYCIIHVES